MATPNAAKSPEVTMPAELEAELRSAEQDFARGDFVELTANIPRSRSRSSPSPETTN